MFADDKRRRVNLGGRATESALTRQQVVERSRLEREQRSRSRLEASAALRLQSAFRSFRALRAARATERSWFDAQMKATSQQPQPHALHQLCRSLCFFARRPQDDARWAALRSWLLNSLKSRDARSHYAAFVARSTSSTAASGTASAASSSSSSSSSVPSADRSASFTFARLIAFCLADIALVDSVPESNAANSALLLFMFVNASTWPAATSDLSSSTLSTSASSSAPSASAAELDRAFILSALKPFIVPKVQCDTRSRQSLTHERSLFSWHESLARRLLHQTSQLDLQPSSPPLVTPALKNTVGLLCMLAVLPLELHQEQTIPVVIAQSFTLLFLALPLLKPRLSALGLEPINKRLFQRVAYDCASKALAEQRTAGALISTLPLLPSATAHDQRPPSPIAMLDDDEDSDDDGDDAFEQTLPRRREAPPRTIDRSLWLAANLIDNCAASFSEHTLRALELLFAHAPALHFPSAQHVIHPLLVHSLQSLLDRPFITRLIQIMELQGGSSFDLAASCSSLVTSLVAKWSNGQSLLSALSFAPGFCRALFFSLERNGAVTRMLLAGTPRQDKNERLSDPTVMSLLNLFCTSMELLLPIISDAEFFGDHENTNVTAGERGSPLPISSLDRLVSLLVASCYVLFWSEIAPAHFRLRSRVARVLSLLRDRQARRQFTSSSSVWMMSQLSFSVIEGELKEMESDEDGEQRPRTRSQRLFAALPFVFPFSSRLAYFYSRIDQEKMKLEPSIDFGAGRGVKARIRRTHLIQDAFHALSELGDRLKGRVGIEFIDANGLVEPGLDGGGVLREFLQQMIAAAVEPSLALFVSSDQGEVAPHPDALPLCPNEGERQQLLRYYHFMGQMIGKAIFEKLTIGLAATQAPAITDASSSAATAASNASNASSAREPQFAIFFLRKLLGHTATLDDLASFDPPLYRGLMSLTKLSSEELQALRLTFVADRRTTNEQQFETVPLVAGGQQLVVDEKNLTHYLHATADWRLNRSINRPCAAFARGLHQVIPRNWLSVFAADELRLLICGSESIDLQDLRHNTVYASGYSENHECIKWFWAEVSEWSHADRALLLRFVTSVPRAPLTGFASLNPRFGIQRCDLDGRGENTLPTSATCMNLLRLPRYTSRAQLRDRLLYSIRNGLGFGLT